MLLKKSKFIPGQTLRIGGSKSISNRLLLLQQLFGATSVENFSESQDSELMQKALRTEMPVVDIHHAGTAMRFLTSYFAIQNGRTVVITGSDRMKQRPIGFLVEALRQLGAEIEYLGQQDHPPLKITGKTLRNNKVSIPANVSSQFITSLLLIAGKLENGLTLELVGDIASRPYLEMTLKMLTDFGIENSFDGNRICVKPATEKNHTPAHYTIESDWSSASYFYSLAAIAKQPVVLKSFIPESLQADAALASIYEQFFGIKTTFKDSSEISLEPILNFNYPKIIALDMNSCPDIAQTVCVTAAAMHIQFKITGLSTLKVKETDRLIALREELIKIGCQTSITNESIVSTAFLRAETVPQIKTYNDHRMAMSFAPYCLMSNIEIEDPNVVEKSYPSFWNDLQKVVAPA